MTTTATPRNIAREQHPAAPTPAATARHGPLPGGAGAAEHSAWASGAGANLSEPVEGLLALIGPGALIDTYESAEGGGVCAWSCLVSKTVAVARMEEPMAQQLGQMGRETHMLARGTR